MKAISIDLLTVIWLDGFASGVTTANINHGVPEEIADGLAQRTAHTIYGDRDALELVRSEIRQRLEGFDLGPITHRVRRDPEPET